METSDFEMATTKVMTGVVIVKGNQLIVGGRKPTLMKIDLVKALRAESLAK